MTIETLVTKLEAAGFDVYLNEADVGTFCPYIVLINITNPNFAADNKVYTKTTSLDLRLVESEVHDWKLIQTLEDTLDKIPLTYNSTDLRDPSEHVCEMNYELTFLGGITNG